MIKLIKKFFMCRWSLLPPQKRDILLYDGIIDNLPLYIKRAKYNILYVRGEEVNIYILLACFLKLNFSSKKYIKMFIKFSKPKIIITFIDNREQFYTLSKENSTPTCFVQFGIRSEIKDIFNKKNIINPLNKKKFFVDYMLTFNEAIGKKYKKFIKGKNYAIGSFKNNMWPSKNKTKIDKTIVFVSSYRANKEKNDTFKNDSKIINYLYNQSLKNNFKFVVLGCTTKHHQDLEKKFYDNTIKGSYKFFTRQKNPYFFLDKYKYIIGIDSTLAIEMLVKGIRSCFFYNRPYKKPTCTRGFGYMEGLPRSGPNWTLFNQEKKWDKVFKFLLHGTDKEWRKTINEFGFRVMRYDPNNTIFLNLIKKFIIIR